LFLGESMLRADLVHRLHEAVFVNVVQVVVSSVVYNGAKGSQKEPLVVYIFAPSIGVVRTRFLFFSM
jgi:hypothetical protein